MKLIYLLFFFLWLTICYGIPINELARGWGDRIDWKFPLDEALKHSKEEGKPAMVIIWKNWCGACKKLRSSFELSGEIRELSKNFVMVNLRDEEEPKDPDYSPDGTYIPRIFFVDPATGKPRKELVNDLRQKHKYFFSDAVEVARVMRQAHKLFESESKKEL